MSSQIRISVTAEASQAAEALKNLGDEAEQAFNRISTGASRAEENTKKAKVSARQLIQGVSGLATSAWALYQGYDRLVDAQVGVDRAMVSAKAAANSLEDAQRRYNDAVAKYGAESPQAVAALKDLEVAQERAAVAQERAQMVQENLRESYIGFALGVVPSVITMVSQLSSVMSMLHGATGALSGAMSFLAANPIVLVIAGIAALAAGLIWAYQNCEPFRNAVNGIGEAFMRVLGPAIDAVRGALEWLWRYVVEPFIGVLRTFWDTVTNNPILAALFGPITTVTYLIRNWDSVTRALGETWNAICSGISWAWDTFVKPIVDAAKWFADTLHGIFMTLFGWLVGGSVWVDLCSGMAGIWRSTLQGILDFGRSIVQGIVSLFTGLANTLGNIWGGIKNTLSSVWSSIQNTAGGIWNSISGAVGSAWNTITGIVGSSVKEVRSDINTLYREALAKASEIGETWDKLESSRLSKASKTTAATATTAPAPTVTSTTVTVQPSTAPTTATQDIASIISVWDEIESRRAQFGFEGWVNRPTLILAGEAGSEYVSVRPSGAPPNPVTVNITVGPNTISSDVDIERVYMELSRKLRSDLKASSYFVRSKL